MVLHNFEIIGNNGIMEISPPNRSSFTISNSTGQYNNVSKFKITNFTLLTNIYIYIYFLFNQIIRFITFFDLKNLISI